MQAKAFDNQSGIRERLALLAEVGPGAEFQYWGYHPSRDFWYYHGPNEERRQVAVKQEGARSLELIAERWTIGRGDALALIGYPEAGR